MQFSSLWRSALPALAAAVFSLTIPLVAPLAVRAQDYGVTAPADAPSGGGVARIDAIAGEVAIQRGDSNETLAAVPNAPVLGADYVTTGPTGRAEVGFDGRSAVRLGANVQIRFSNIDQGDRQMQLAAGTIDLRLFGDSDGQSVIDTPSLSVVPRTSGSFRVSVNEDGVTFVTVRAGRADIVTPQGTQSLQPGTTLIAEGAAANPNVRPRAAIALDGFDSYNAERDHMYQLALSQSQYVNTDIQGIGDLEQNGRWADDGTYGHVWMPTNVAADWAPYRDGNWTWEDGYGWTWVAAEPWGWAPYHYGRWYFSNAYHRWAWYPPAPGRYAPAWSPALVGFVGFNIGSVNVGIGFGNIGWVPLAPFEAFHPWWGSHATTIVNNTTIINNNVHYRNIHVNNAMTSVTRENFQNGHFERRTIMSQEQLRSTRAVGMQGALPIVPSQANLRFSERSAPPSSSLRPSFMNRSFAGHPVVSQRTPFNEQQSSVSRATHVALRGEEGVAPSYQRMPERAPQTTGIGTPSFSRGGAGAPNDSWSRFNVNRNADRPNPNVNNAPSFARPGAPSAAAPGTYSRPQPGYNRQDAPSYNRQAPSYNRQAPAYNRQDAPAYNRQDAPSYNRQAPAYTRQDVPTNNRPAAPPPQAPSYNRPDPPSFNRQSPADNRQGTPAFSRSAPPPQAPSYNRQSAPSYNRPAPPAGYTRPAPQADNRSAPAARPAPPAGHETRGNDDRRTRGD